MPDRSDALKRNLKRYLDAGSALSASISKMSRSDVEHALRELTHPGSDARDKVEDAIEELRARSRRGAEQLIDIVRGEVQRDFDVVVTKHRADLADLAERATRLVGAVIGHGSTAADGAPPAKSTAANASGAKKAAAKRSAATSSPAKTTATKAAARQKTSAPKATAGKKASPPKAAAKRAAPASGATKSSAKKAPTKRTSAGVSKATAAKSSGSGVKKASSARKAPAKRTTT